MHDAGGRNRGAGPGLLSPRRHKVITKESSILFWTGAGVSSYIGGMANSYSRNVGRNRGVARVWLEGEMLLANGWNNGDRFNVSFSEGALVYEKNPAGKRKVAGTPDRPILDTNTAKLSKVCGFSTGDKLPVTVTPDKVTVGEAVSMDKVEATVYNLKSSAMVYMPGIVRAFAGVDCERNRAFWPEAFPELPNSAVENLFRRNYKVEGDTVKVEG